MLKKKFTRVYYVVRIVKNYIKYYRNIRKGKQNIIKNFSSGNIKSIDGRPMPNEVVQLYRKTFLKFNRIKPEDASIAAEHFCKNEIQFVKDSYKGKVPKSDIILICNVKNDLQRIKMLLSYYRKMGVKYFSILDNNSTDGTFEWLTGQNIDVLSVKEQYTSKKRKGWILKLIEHYGWNRWYLFVDSDELLTYIDMEKKNIQRLIQELEKKNITRALCFMLDMYAKENNLSDDSREGTNDIENEYCYFDSDSYYMSCRFWGYAILGGPRDRFFENKKVDELLTKYPLAYMKAGEIYGYHDIFPYKENFRTEMTGVLRHYKFLRGDFNKMKTIVKEKNYAGGSILYKKYLEAIADKKKISFFYDGSKKYRDSNDLNEISLFKKLVNQK